MAAIRSMDWEGRWGQRRAKTSIQTPAQKDIIMLGDKLCRHEVRRW